jgi:hypothetical protein
MATLTCQQGTADYFKLHDLPKVTDPQYVYVSPSGYRMFRHFPPLKLSVTRYRIAYGTPWASGKQRSAGFSLGKGHTKEALQVIVKHLNASGVDWLWLCNAWGNRTGLHTFTSKSLAA